MKVVVLAFAAFLSPVIWADQRSPDWTPPKTTVAKELVEAGKFLLEHGMADPRGGVFGLATIKTSIVGFYKPIKRDFLGWSVGEGKTKQFVTLKGIAYPVTVSFKPMVFNQQVSKACQMTANGIVFDGSRPDDLNSQSVGRKSIVVPPEQWFLTDQAVILLLVHRDVKEAEQLYALRKHKVYSSMEPTLEPGLGKLFKAELVDGFMKDLWDQAVGAHMFGDDDLAAQTCSKILANRKQYESFIGNTVSLGYLDQAGILFNDSLRRIKEKPITIDFDKVKKMGQKERIAKCIELLDDSCRFVHGDAVSPGAPQMAPMTLIFKEGTDAGVALLDCLEKDKRLTRRVWSSSVDQPYYRLEMVRDQALSILNSISKVNEFNYSVYNPPPLNVVPPIAELRAKWSALKNLSENQRWLWILKNDKSQPEQWVKAVKALTAQDLNQSKPSINLALLTNQEQDEFKRIVEERVWQLDLPVNIRTQLRTEIHSKAAALATSLMKADKKIGGPVLREVMSRAWNDTLQYESMLDYRYQTPFVEAFNAMIADGDKVALIRYAEWLKMLPIADLLNDRVDPFSGFQFLAPNEADSQVEAIVDSAKFQDAVSQGGGTPASIYSLLKTCIIEYPSFQKLLIKLLSDKTVVGTFAEGVEGNVAAFSTGASKGKWMMGSQLAAAEKDSTCRCCDIVAASFSFNSLSSIDIAWSDAKKDAAIAKLVDMLSGKNSEELKQFLERCRSIRWR